MLSLTPGRRLQSRQAGALLFLPLLAQVGFDRLVAQAGYRGSEMIPAVQALLSLLLLKLLDKERRSHIDAFDYDAGLGLFCGLNVLPKRSFVGEYSYRTVRDNQRSLLSGWVKALSALLFGDGGAFSLDFHPIPHRGEETALENHYVAMRGKATASVQSFFALEQDSRVLCYANADLRRQDQAGEVMRFVEFWRELSGQVPSWLYIDSRVTTYAELSRLNDCEVNFITVRRRGGSTVARLRRLEESAWTKAVIDTPKRRSRHIRYVDEDVRLDGYEGEVRQVAVDGLGRDKPTLLLSNNSEETARQLIIRYAGRNRVEGGLGEAVNFFHLDCLASEVALNVDLDCALTVLAHGCYRWLARQLSGYEKAQPKMLHRRFIDSSGTIEIHDDHLAVTLARRSYNPVLRQAALERHRTPIPWLGNRFISFAYT